MDDDGVGKWIVGIVVFCLLLIGVGMWGFPQYNVWSSELSGRAALGKATQDRQIVIEEAKAKKESALLLAEGEVIRARGVAEANEIVAKSLGGPQGYLQWRYITMLEETGKGSGRETIYIPTEGMMPITEASRLKATAQR